MILFAIFKPSLNMIAQRNISSSASFFSFFLALHLLNFSIDSKDAHPDYIVEDLTYNDIESILEFTFEILLGFDNAFFEYDEEDEEDGSRMGFYLFYAQPSAVYNSLIREPLVVNYSLPATGNYIENFLPVHSPPPESFRLQA